MRAWSVCGILDDTICLDARPWHRLCHSLLFRVCIFTLPVSLPLCGGACSLVAELTTVVEQKLANDEFAALHPGDKVAANQAFVAFTGLFGQVGGAVLFLSHLHELCVLNMYLGQESNCACH